jgi:hypothetical protein
LHLVKGVLNMQKEDFEKIFKMSRQAGLLLLSLRKRSWNAD